MSGKRLLLGLAKPLLLVFVLLFVMFFYTLLHEIGHALVTLLFGGTLLGFNVNFVNMSAHALIQGRFTALEQSLIAVAGLVLPLLAWVLFLLVAPRRANPLLQLLKVMSSFGVLGSLWPWVATSLLYRQGLAPAGHDATWLLQVSRLNPLLVAGASLVLFLAGCRLFLSRMGGLREALGVLAASGEELLGTGAPRSLLAMAGVWAMGGIVVLAINAHIAAAPLA